MNVSNPGPRFKDPQETKDFGVDWTTPLDQIPDTISSSTWTLTGTLTSVATSNTTKTTSIRIAGGVAGEDCTVTNHVVLAGGQQWEVSFTLRVLQQ